MVGNPPHMDWAVPCSAGVALMLSILGLFIGRAQDTRDSLKDLVN